MHPKFLKRRALAGYGPDGSFRFRIPDPERPTNQLPDACAGALLNAALTLMLNTPEYQQSALTILEMGVSDGMFKKRLNVIDGTCEYTIPVLIPNKPTQRK